MNARINATRMAILRIAPYGIFLSLLFLNPSLALFPAHLVNYLYLIAAFFFPGIIEIVIFNHPILMSGKLYKPEDPEIF